MGIVRMAKHDKSGSERFRDRERRDRDYKKQLPGEDDEPLPTPVDPIRTGEKPGRNSPCPCGSGKKYKACCGRGE